MADSKPNEAAETVENLLEEMIGMQRAKVFKIAQRLIPNVTADDVLTAIDFPALATDPNFNFEDGVLAGLLQAQMGLRVSLRSRGGERKIPEAKN